MKPNRRDVETMVPALIAVTQGVGRAARKGDASRLTTLIAIGMAADSNPKALSETLGVHASSVTRQVQALEREDLVNVKADPEDGRSCRVTLTVVGRAEIARLTEIGMGRFVRLVAKWEAAEVRELGRLLRKLELSRQELAAEEARESAPPDGSQAGTKTGGVRWRQER